MGEDFSAKDFRTWAATLAAAQALCLEGAAEDRPPSKATVTTCVKAVAGLLGNTPSVCRASYIHPCVFEAYEAGRLSPDLTAERAKAERALLQAARAGWSAAPTPPDRTQAWRVAIDRGSYWRARAGFP